AITEPASRATTNTKNPGRIRSQLLVIRVLDRYDKFLAHSSDHCVGHMVGAVGQPGKPQGNVDSILRVRQVRRNLYALDRFGLLIKNQGYVVVGLDVIPDHHSDFIGSPSRTER